VGLIDFGHTADINIKVTHVVGTEDYQPPEVLSVFKEYNKKFQPFNADKCDSFTIGVVLFVLAFGEFPFKCKRGNTDQWYNCLMKQQYKVYYEGKMKIQAMSRNI
jgi:serine/threonine protein kinase